MSVLVVDKPPGLTSFQVVHALKQRLPHMFGQDRARRLKIGHGGTLDPLATGVLPVCIGEATKLAPFLLDADKTYETDVRLGVETDTLDADGAVTATHAVPALTEPQLSAAFAAFTGEIEQVPPMYSALKRQGRPLYEYARRGEEVERMARRVHIFALELLGWCPPDALTLRVRCSKGTYVRVLATDLGRALGAGGAHLTRLRRTASGPFELSQAVPLAELERRIDARESLPWISLPAALAHLAAVSVTAQVSQSLERGQPVDAESIGIAGDAPWRLLRPDGTLVAVAVRSPAGRVATLRVFGPDDVP